MNRIIITMLTVMIMFILGSGIGEATSTNLVANFSSNVTSGYAPLSIQFNDTSIGIPESREWDFGDGSPNSTEQNPNHTYSLAGTYIVTLNVSNAAGCSTKEQANCITVLNNSDSGSLTLINTDFSQSSSIPRGIYIESTKDRLSNVTLTYNNTLKCADITYIKPTSGNLFFANLYPTTDSNITYTLGTEGVSDSSYLNIVASNSIVIVVKESNGNYKLASYWTADNESTQYDSITVPAESIIDNKVTFSVVCYESNRTNMLKYNDTVYTKTPFRTINTRNQNYVFVNQPMVYFSSYFASGDAGPYVIHLYSIKQEIPRKTITPYGTRSISAFTITYPDPENNGNGTDLMESNGQKGTVYVDADHLNSATVEYEKALLNTGWEMGIHYTENLGTMSNEAAIATMDDEYNTIVNTYGRQPKTWAARGSSGNISQAIYAYQRYGMIWRSCESGTSWLSVGNLCNTYWQWWNTSISHGIVFPAFTIATDKEPVTGSSINESYFTMFSNGFAANNIRLCGLSEYYFTQSAQNTTQVNITDYDNSYMRFTVNTGGYPCTLNIMTDMPNVAVSHVGVTVPYTCTNDGILFTAKNNTAYELRSLSASSGNEESSYHSSDGRGSSGNDGGGGGRSGGGSPEPAKNVQVKEISQAFITNGKPVRFDFTKNATCVVYISFDAKKTFGKTASIAEMLKGRSALVSELPAEEIYKSFNVWVGNGGIATSKNIEDPVVCFKVEKTWIKDNKIDPDAIALMRYSDKKWERFPVKLLEEDNEFLYFAAETSGFSSFAITGTTKNTSEETVTKMELNYPETINKNNTTNREQQTVQEETPRTSGFEIYCGVYGLLAVFLYKRK